MSSLSSLPSLSPPTKYIPFQTLPKSAKYRILNYGRPYTNYTHYSIPANGEGITDIYVDREFVTIPNISNLHHVEIHSSNPSTTGHTPIIKEVVLDDHVLDELIGKYGCKL